MWRVRGGDGIRTAAPTALLWRFDTATYRGGIGLTATLTPRLPAVDALRQLRECFDTHRTPLHEESLLDLLLDDLWLAG